MEGMKRMVHVRKTIGGTRNFRLLAIASSF